MLWWCMVRISGPRLWAVAPFRELEPSSLEVANIIRDRQARTWRLTSGVWSAFLFCARW
jgi:hypothetical protein